MRFANDIGAIFMVAILNHMTFAASQDGPIDVTTGKYTFSEMLDDNFQLQWNFNSSHIVFETRVKTNGYIGFGISGNGKMIPSDVVIGWVSNGKVHFGDRHAKVRTMPQLDAVQDWHLVKGEEAGDYTTLTFIRRLDTCDDQDMPIKEGTTRVIYSYSPTDPLSDDSISYHGPTNRGTKSLLLLDPPSSDQDFKMPADVKTMDFLAGNYSVPSSGTTYTCSAHKLMDLKGKHHVIRYEPVIQSGHELLVHHMILYFCHGSLPDDIIGNDYLCYTRQEHSKLRQCRAVFTAWAIGGTAFNYPPHVGHSLGTSIDPTYFRLEIHYDNPGRRGDFVDNSGIRFFLTKQIRQFDAGMLESGVHVDDLQVIPPSMPAFVSKGYCHEDCIASGLGDGKMNVIAATLHSHLLGRKMRTRIIRNGTELPPLVEDNNYDFNFQELRALPEERVIQKGDALITECVYDSSQRNALTFGGLSTQEEMCLSFILYYPRTNINKCSSRLRYDTSSKFGDRYKRWNIRKLDWSKESTRNDYMTILDEVPFDAICSGQYYYGPGRTSQFDAKIPYVPPNMCNN